MRAKKTSRILAELSMINGQETDWVGRLKNEIKILRNYLAIIPRAEKLDESYSNDSLTVLVFSRCLTISRDLLRLETRTVAAGRPRFAYLASSQKEPLMLDHESFFACWVTKGKIARRRKFRQVEYTDDSTSTSSRTIHS
jgi:hypothetical protein